MSFITLTPKDPELRKDSVLYIAPQHIRAIYTSTRGDTVVIIDATQVAFNVKESLDSVVKMVQDALAVKKPTKPRGKKNG